MVFHGDINVLCNKKNGQENCNLEKCTKMFCITADGNQQDTKPTAARRWREREILQTPLQNLSI